MANKLKFVLLVATVLATMNAGVFALDIEVELPMPKMAAVPLSGMNPDGPPVKFYVQDLVTCRPYCEAVYSKVSPYSCVVLLLLTILTCVPLTFRRKRNRSTLVFAAAITSICNGPI